MKNKELTFNIGANLGPSFSSSFGKAGEAVSGLGKVSEHLKLKQKEANLSVIQLNKSIEESPNKLIGLEKSMLKTGLSINGTKKRMADLSKEMKSGKANKELQKQYFFLNTRLKELNTTYKTQKTEVNENKIRMSEEKIQVEKLGKEYSDLGKKIAEAEKLKKKFSNAKAMKSRGETISGYGGKPMRAGAVGLGGVTASVKLAIDAEEAFADVKKQFDFATKEEENQFKEALNKVITEKKMAISVKDLYASAAAGGQSGLKAEEAVPYIELSTKMAIAFDMNREEAAQAMFNMKNAFKLPLADLTILADKINMLGNSTGANAGQVTDFVNRVGNIGQMAGFGIDQVAALGATLIEQGMSSEIAATGAKKLYNAMSSGFATTKTGAEAFKMLGLNPEQIAKDAQKDAEGTLNTILTKISTVEKDKQGAILKLLFGEEGQRAASGAVSNLNKLMKNFANVRDKSMYDKSMEKEYKARSETVANQLEVLKANLTLSGGAIGSVLLPEVNKLIGKILQFSNYLSDLQKSDPEAFSKFIKVFAYGSIALLGLGSTLKVVGGTFKTFGSIMEITAMASEKKVFGRMLGGVKKLSFGFVGSIGKIGKAMWALGSNPVVLVIAGIVALVAAGYALYKNWDTVKKKGMEFGKKIGELVEKFWWLLGGFGVVVKGGIEIYRNWDKISAKSVELKQKIVDMVIGWIENFHEFKAKTKEVLGMTFDWINEKWEGIKTKGASVLNYFISIYEKISGIFGGIGNKISGAWEGTKNMFTGGNQEEDSENPKRMRFPMFASGGNTPAFAMAGGPNPNEPIMPNNNFPPSLNLGEKMGQMIMAYDKKQAVQNNIKAPVTFTYSPKIASNNTQEVKEILEKDKKESFNQFKLFYDKLEKEKERRGNGR